MLDAATIDLLASESIVELRPGSASPYLLIAEHAGNRVPAPWRNLGLAGDFLDTHFAVDIGIEALARRLSEDLDAPAVLGCYSRLFLDYNRPQDAWDYVRPDLGGIPVPANSDATPAERELRNRIGWAPLEAAICRASAGRAGLVSIHSFTPVMAGQRRDVDIGILWKKRTPFIDAVLAGIEAHGAEAGFRIGDNAPYDWRAVTAYTLDRHGIERDVPCLYLEVRNTLLVDPPEFEKVARILSRVLVDASTSLPDAGAIG